MGNDTLWTISHYPSSYKEVIGVSAINAYSELASYSNFGPDVECTAPGGEGYQGDDRGIMSTYIDNDYRYLSGTSMACPHVSAICALIQAHFPYAIDPPSARIGEVRNILWGSCIDQPPPGWDEYFGWGRVNLERTMQNIVSDAGLNASPVRTQADELTGFSNDSLPAVWYLYQNYPNPVRGNTTLAFDVPAGEGNVAVGLDVYDLAGRRVAVVARENLGPGKHNFLWDCTSTSGGKVPPGVYIYRLRAGDQALTRKLVVAH